MGDETETARAATGRKPDTAHFGDVVTALSRSETAPIAFLGAGVNLCTRPTETKWSDTGAKYLPNAVELTKYIAGKRQLPYRLQRSSDLERAAQGVAMRVGYLPLYHDLHEIFDGDYAPTPVHALLARAPEILRSKGYSVAHPFIVTTNYDDLMERALIESGCTPDVVYYLAEGPHQGRFAHRAPGEKPRLVERPNKYRGLDLSERPVVLKMHGAVRRGDRLSTDEKDQDSYVITEDHYINYLAHADLTSLVPQPLPALLKNNPFLFLGYRLGDWNMRVILHRIWRADQNKNTSWAIQRDWDEVQVDFWRQKKVLVLQMDLLEYVSELSRSLEALSPKQATPANRAIC